MNALRAAPALALAACAATAAEPVALDDIQVTGSREESRAFDQPQPLTLLDGEEVQRRSPQVLAQALAYEPGAFFQSSGPGQGIVIVRGLKGSEVLHLVDGMRLNNAFFRNAPSQYIALVDAQNVARLELLRGPYATVYGSDAMGGVVQLLTPEHRFDGAALDWSAGAQARYASADVNRAGRAHAAVGNQAFSLAAGYSFSEYGRRKLAEPGQSPDGAGGFTLAERVADTEYLSRAWDAKALWAPAAGHELMLSVQHFEIPELQRYFQTVPGFSGGAPARAIAQFMNERTFWHARWRFDGALGLLEDPELHLARQVMYDDRLDRTQTNSRDQFDASRSTLDGLTAQAHTTLGAHRLSYGLEVYLEELNSSSARESPPGSGNFSAPNGTSYFSPFPDGSEAQDYGVYVLDRWTPAPDWLLEGGLRYTARRTVVARGDRAFGATLDNDDLSGNLGLRYALTPQLAWTANLGRGFRAPNLFDLALVGQRANNRVVVANRDLQPESVVTLDTGLKFDGAALDGELSVYAADYRDRIATVNPAFSEGAAECPDDGDAATTGCAQNRNIAKSRYHGLEAGARWSLAPQLALRGVLNWTWGDQDDGTTKTPANRVPPLNGRVAAEYALDRALDLEAFVFFADDQGRLDPNDLSDSRIDPRGTPGYAVWNVRAVWQPHAAIELQLDGSNLLDKAYREHGSGIDGPGRGIGVSARVAFD